jgi:hypothetical protein
MKCYMRIRKLAIAVSVCIMAWVVAAGARAAELTYRETTARNVKEVSYTCEEYDSAVYIRAEYNDESQIVTTDRNFRTKNMKIISTESPVPLIIHKDGDRLFIEGSVEKTVPVEPDISWFQLPLCLKSFVLSADKKIRFYALSSNFDERLASGKGIQLIKLTAIKEAFESIDVAGTQVGAVKVLIKFEYIPALFWKAYYWYRIDDGVLIRYSEARGAPGTPKTIGELIHEVGAQ